jgi:hypothetical protein
VIDHVKVELVYVDGSAVKGGHLGLAVNNRRTIIIYLMVDKGFDDHLQPDTIHIAYTYTYF